jgi:tetratricopeptide (TPR) repeat protein
MILRYSAFLLILILAAIPGSSLAQYSEVSVDEAAALYRSGQPVAAGEQLRAVLTSANSEQFPKELIAKAYTYLTMAEWALYRRDEAEGAMESALRRDGRVFAEFAGEWAKDNPAVTDTISSMFLANGVRFYEEAEFDRAVSELSIILPIEDALDPFIAADLHKTLAFCYIAMRKTNIARLEFRTALRLNNRLDLGDDSVIAPKLRRAFLAVRRDVLSVDRSTLRRNTLVRSLFLPGWGQVYRGARIRGFSFMAAELMLLTGTAFSIRSFTGARDAYLSFGVEDAVAIYGRGNSISDVTAELDARFNRYESKGRRTNLLIGLAAGVWIANLADALILTLQKDGTGFASRQTEEQSGVSMAWRPEIHAWQLTYGITW